MRCVQEIAVGAYLLDVLEPDERARMREHVAQCPICSEAVEELAGVPPLLAGVSPPAEAPMPPAPSELAYQRLRSAAAPPVSPSSARWRSWRTLAVAAAAVVVIGGGVAVGVVATSGSGTPAPTAITASASGVTAHADIVRVGAGSSITLTLTGVPMGQRCRLEVFGRDGAQDASHWWTITSDGPLSWTYSVDVSPDDLDHMNVVAADGRTLLTLRP